VAGERKRERGARVRRVGERRNEAERREREREERWFLRRGVFALLFLLPPATPFSFLLLSCYQRQCLEYKSEKKGRKREKVDLSFYSVVVQVS